MRCERRATRECRGAHRAHRLVRRFHRKTKTGWVYYPSSAVAGSTCAQMRHHMSSYTAVGPVLSAMTRESESVAKTVLALSVPWLIHFSSHQAAPQIHSFALSAAAANKETAAFCRCTHRCSIIIEHRCRSWPDVSLCRPTCPQRAGGGGRVDVHPAAAHEGRDCVLGSEGVHDCVPPYESCWRDATTASSGVCSSRSQCAG